MRKSYILIYNDELGTREEVRDFVDKIKSIINWKYDLPNTFYLVSEESAQNLYNQISSLKNNKKGARFLIAEVSSNKQGWLPKETWHLLNEKPDPGK